jgi:hypothetical protein
VTAGLSVAIFRRTRSPASGVPKVSKLRLIDLTEQRRRPEELSPRCTLQTGADRCEVGVVVGGRPAWQCAASHAREPEHLFGDGQAALEELPSKAARLAPADDSRARALQRARTERVGLAVPALQQPLEHTA